MKKDPLPFGFCLLHYLHRQADLASRLLRVLQEYCVVRSSSGDIDIPVILLANEMQNLLVYVDNGAGKNRKVMDFFFEAFLAGTKTALVNFW